MSGRSMRRTRKARCKSLCRTSVKTMFRESCSGKRTRKQKKFIRAFSRAFMTTCPANLRKTRMCK